MRGSARKAASGQTSARTAAFYRNGGPEMAPLPSSVRSGPAQPCRSAIEMGAPTWPPCPRRSERPGTAVPLLYRALLHWRERGRAPDLVDDALDERAVGLAGLARGQPFGVGLECLPDAVALSEIRPGQDVDHLVRLADDRLPEADDVDPVLLEELHRDVAEASLD